RSRETAVLGMRQQFSQLPRPLGLRSRRVDGTQLWIEKPNLRSYAGRLIAAVELECSVGEHRRQSVSVGELPMIDEAVVAARTLDVRPKEDLRHRLRRLNFAPLALVDCPAPFDPKRKAFAAPF